VTAEEPFGARLRRLREAAGLSRTELAAACTRLGRRTEANDIYRYEAGLYWPRVPTFAALARALGVSMEELLYGEAEAARIAWERERG
jgi:transcriptional regulator with XRE-family HTH domain